MFGNTFIQDIILTCETNNKIDRAIDYIESKLPYKYQIKQNIIMEHKNKYTKKDSDFLLNKYPDRVPIIIDKAPGTNLSEFHKNKFLAPKDMKVHHLHCIIRKQFKLKETEAIFIYCDKFVLSSSCLIIEIYEKYKYENGFLYLTVSAENTFGN